jgi:serine/threonine protein kinase
MNMRNNGCNQQRIEDFLNSRSVTLDEPELLAHLDSCEDCRKQMELKAAEREYWSDAEELLKPKEFDNAVSSIYSTATGRSRHPTPDATIQCVIDSLAPTDDPNRIGRLAGYEVTGVIGLGGMGVVLKAIDPALDRVVAIKVMAPHLANNATARKRFSREAKAAATVLHPNVIPIHSVSSDESVPFLVMAYIRGGSLKQRLDRVGFLSTLEVLRIGSQVAAGLAAAHEQGLIHRDIKPENILLEDGIDRVTLTDFGLARAVDDTSVTREGTIAGTPQYMSPEQARGESVDQGSDLFSLGSVLYTLCTGRPPFRAESSYGVMRKISDEEATPIRELNPDIPDWLVLIIQKLMAKDKSDRFDSAGEVRELLEACLSHVQHPTIFKLPQQLARKRHFAFRKRFSLHVYPLTTGVLTMLCLLTAIAFGIFFQTNPSEPLAQFDETIAEVLGHGYSRQGDFIFFDKQRIDQAGKDDFARFAKSTNLKLKQCADIDATSFKALSEEYTKDKNKVYFKWISNRRFWVVELPLADAKSFEVINSNLARDTKQVWWYGEPLPEVDPKTVELVNAGFVWKDAKRVWYQRNAISGADAKTFRHLDQAFYRDANRVYWSSTPLEGADLDTFRTFGEDSPYGADRNNIWRASTKISGYDASTFEAIHQSVIKDKNGVYANDHLIENAAPGSFRKVVDLDTSHTALLADEHHYYVFLPYYGDIYRITSMADSLRVERSIWPPGIKQKEPIAVATAELGEAGWKAIRIAADPAIETAQLKDRETHVLNIYTPQVTKAWEIIRQRKVQKNSVAQTIRAEPIPQDNQPKEKRPSSEGWQSDIVAFETYLGELVGKARIPDKPSLEMRVTVVPGSEKIESEVWPVTDGAGGYADMAPAEDTVQFQVNKALKGQKVTWEFELAHNTANAFNGVAQVVPKSISTPNAKPFLATLIINTTDELDFKSGDRVKLEGTIGDASQNKSFAVLSGPVAIYHLDSTPHPVFWIGLKNVKISGPTRKTTARIQPAKEVTAFAKELLRACMAYDETKLIKLYASEVQLLPGNRLFYFGLEVPGKMTEYGVPIKREDMLVALKKQAARDPMPSFMVSTFVNSYKIEQLDVAIGDYITEPNQPSESLYRSLRFKIEENDVLLRISVPGAFRFVQLRQLDEQWKVIAEY